MKTIASTPKTNPSLMPLPAPLAIRYHIETLCSVVDLSAKNLKNRCIKVTFDNPMSKAVVGSIQIYKPPLNQKQVSEIFRINNAKLGILEYCDYKLEMK